LRKGHKVAISQTNEEAAGVEGADVLSSHHHDIGDAAEQTSNPKALPPADIGSHDAGRSRADESAERHER